MYVWVLAVHARSHIFTRPYTRMHALERAQMPLNMCTCSLACILNGAIQFGTCISISIRLGTLMGKPEHLA